MKTHTLLFVSIAIFFAVTMANSFTRPANANIVNNPSVEQAEELVLEKWMVDDHFWGIEKETSRVIDEEPEREMEIESWMYDDEYWGLS
ncbi:MAG: hypothetical protein PF486_09315 [Prolixibacteraceae bacterium]|jgi:hypothetical protein|nr:hypothetical protein [Prolixibacteraceae bacterium]